MTDPNADQQNMLTPATDPWADQTTDPWASVDPSAYAHTPGANTPPANTPPANAPTVAASPGQAPGRPPGPHFTFGQAGVPAAHPYSAPPMVSAPGYPSVPQPPSGKGSRAVAVIGAVVVVVVIGAGILIIPKLINKTPTPASSSGNVATGSGTGTTPAVADIFAGTPAANFAKGADGIVLPAATAVPGFTTAEVSADLAQVKKGMIAGRLDPQMLTQHDQTVLTSVLAPDARADIIKDFEANNAFPFATELAGGTVLTGDPIRVSGTITISGEVRDGVNELDIVSNYIWVYPVAAGRAGSGANLIVVHDAVTWNFAGAGVAASSRGMWVGEAHGYASNVDCAQIKNGLLAINKSVVTMDDLPVTEADSPYQAAPNFATVKIRC